MPNVTQFGSEVLEFFRKLFDSSDFLPRNMCGNWTAGQIWLHMTSDILIWLAYLAIPLLLAFFAWRQRSVPFHGLFWLFCAFIMACGFSHLLDSMMFRLPVYRLLGAVKLTTAVVSWATVLAMIPIMPRALDLVWELDVRNASLPAPGAAKARVRVPGQPSTLERYSVAMATMILAVTVRALLIPMLGKQILFLPLLLAVLVSSWFGGIGPGLLAALGGVIAGFVLQGVAPETSPLGMLGDLVSLGFFLLVAVGVTLITESQRAAHRRVSRSVQELLENREELESEIRRRREVELELRNREQELERQAGRLEEVRRRTAESLAVLDAFVEHAPIGMLFLDSNHRLLNMNRVLAEMMQSPVAPPSLGTMARGSVPALADEIESLYRRVLKTEEPLVDQLVRTGETDGARDDRSWTVGVFPVRIGDQAPIGVGGVVQEITERLRAEDRIRESETRFRALAESVPQFVWSTHPDGRVYYFNQRWYDYTGLAEDESLDDRWVDALHPDDREHTVAVWGRAVEGGSSYEVEYRFRRADGACRWFLGRGTPQRDAAGAIVRWTGTSTDIDDLKQAQEALQESQERFRVLAETIPQMVWTAEPGGEVNYFNQRWYDYTGLPLEASADESWPGVIHPEDLPGVVELWEEARRQGTPLQLEMRVRRGSDGTYRWHLVRGVPLRGRDGSVTQWVGSTTDVDDQHRQSELLERLVADRTRELERSNQELDQFASVASHDLQEPLRKIQAFGDRLKTATAGQLGDRGEEYLERILSSSARLRTLIDDLLRFARVTSAAAPFEPVDLNQILREVVSDLEALVQSMDGRVLVHRMPPLEADASQMRQLFMNLIGNALKFHRPGEPPVVTVEAREIISDDDPPGTSPRCEIRVEDNGIGFAEEYRERIFKLFERLHGRVEYDGTGMGLAICRKIVERHGGTIRAEGRPERGATFVIELPLHRDPSQEGESRE